MRTVMVSDFPSSPADAMGGLRVAVVNLVRALAETQGIEVVVLDPSPTASEVSVESWGFCEVRRLPAGPAAGRIRRSRHEIARAVRSISPDIVHLQGSARLATGLVPEVLTVHGLLEQEIPLLDAGVRGRIRQWAVARPEISARHAAKNVCVINPFVAQNWEADVDRRIWCIPNAIPLGFPRATARVVGKQVTFAGFLTPLKNPLTLIDAFSRVLERHPDATLALAGGPLDGPYADSCRAMVEARGISAAVTFLGQLDRAALAGVLGDTRVLALPSLAENAPMVISEAFWMGVPVVASDVGGVRHMVRDGVDGIVVPPGDTQCLGDALVEVLSEGEDRKWAENATEAGAVYAPERVAAQTLSMYEEVVRRGDSRPSA